MRLMNVSDGPSSGATASAASNARRALLSQNVLLAAFASRKWVMNIVMNIHTSILSESLPTLVARADELIE